MYNVRIPTNRERYYETQRKPAAKSRSRATKKAAQRAACQISAAEYMAGSAGGAGADRADHHTGVKRPLPACRIAFPIE